MVWFLHDQRPNMRNRFSWLGSTFTPWGILNQLIPQLTFSTNFQHFFHIGYQYSTHCHCESTLFLYANFCHCNIHFTFSNTPFYSNINKWQLSIKTITRTHNNSTHIHKYVPPAKWDFLDYCHFLKTRQVPQLKATRMYYITLYLHNLASSFFFMKRARREDIHMLESKFFISLQSTFFQLQYFS